MTKVLTRTLIVENFEIINNESTKIGKKEQ